MVSSSEMLSIGNLGCWPFVVGVLMFVSEFFRYVLCSFYGVPAQATALFDVGFSRGVYVIYVLVYYSYVYYVLYGATRSSL